MRHLGSVQIACAVASVVLSLAPALAQETPEALERDLSVTQKPIYELGKLPNVRAIEVDASVNKPNLTYFPGEPLRVTVRPRRDAFITIIDVGTSGKVAMIFPNHFQKARRIDGGETVTIPLARAKWEIKVGGPPGIELVQVIASRRPLSLREMDEITRATEESPMVSLGRSAEDVARDLTPQLKEPESRQAIGIRNLLFRVAPRNASLSAPEVRTSVVVE